MSSIAIESYEHWGIGFSPVVSYLKNSDHNNESESGAGFRFFYRKNMKEISVEVGADFLNYPQSNLDSKTFFVIGRYKFQYMDSWDFSMGIGGGYKNPADSDSLFIYRGGILFENDFKKNQTVGVSLDMNRSIENYNQKKNEILLSLNYAFYFGVYTF